MKNPKLSTPKLAGIFCLAAALPLHAELLVYEGFEYGNPGDPLHGQPDGSGIPSDVDAIGLGGTWQDQTSLTSSDFRIVAGSLVFGDLPVKGNHVAPVDRLNNDIMVRPITADLAAGTELWFGILAEKVANNFNNGQGGLVIGSQAVNNSQINKDTGSTGLVGFGFGPTTAGTNWTPFAWNGTSQTAGDAALAVGVGTGDVRLLVGHVSFNTGTGGADEYTLYELQLNAGSIDGGTLSPIASTIEIDIDETQLDTLSLTRHVETSYDEIRMAVTFDELLGGIFDDDDEDGIPNWWEEQYFGGPTAADANALSPDQTGLTNLEQYELGTDPTNPDTDGDGLLDGGAITVTSADSRYGDWAALGILFSDDGGDRTFRGEAALGTDPTNPDTDGDGLPDGVETGTGVWVGTNDTGTNPNLADTDGDGLPDGVETNTGILVDTNNTGTNPNLGDTDGDGAGDWYEIVAAFTDPFDPNDKPNVPYPLPAPDGSPGASDKPVKVYIMSGQSNMVGFGTVSGTGDHTLETMTIRQNKFPNLIDGSDGWTTRQDVRYRGVISDIANAQLSPGALGSTFGPELGFGYIMGWYHDEPVLLLKSSIGNRSLGWDILPPGSTSYVYNDTNYAGYGDFGNWPVGEDPPAAGGWYAGKEFDTFFRDEAEMGPPVGWQDGFAYPNNAYIHHNGVPYRAATAHTSTPDSEPGVGANWQDFWNLRSDFNVTDVLDHFATEYPQWAAQGFEIAGFVWWQGDKDRYDMGHATRYEENLVNLINSLRDYYTNRYPGKVVVNAPFVLATLGQTPLDSTNAAEKAILDAQLAVDGESGNYPQFSGNVKTVYAHPLSEGGASNGHYNQRAGTYMLVGDALGRSMVELLEGDVVTPGDTFGDWIAGYDVGGLTGFDDDADGDGLANGIEAFFGTPPDASTPGLAEVERSGNTVTFTHPEADPPLADVTGSYEWSLDLAQWNASGASADGTTVTLSAQQDIPAAGTTTVTATIADTVPTRIFVRVVAVME